MLYKAFISYSHSADGKLAPAVQAALHRFAKPLYKLRGIRTFRDETTLALTPKLWPTIEKALGESEYFVLLASPTAAGSPWVKKETGWWALNRAMDNGLTQLQASEVLTHIAFYAGWPNAFSALPVVKEVFEKRQK